MKALAKRVPRKKNMAAEDLKLIPAEILSHVMTISQGNNCRDNQPTKKEMSVQDLMQQFATPDTARGKLSLDEYRALDKSISHEKKFRGSEKDGTYIILGEFASQGTRKKEDLEFVSGFMCDIDSGSLSQADIEHALSGVFFIAYSTYSYHPDAPRWRVIVPYSSPIKPEDHEACYEYFQSLFDRVLDPSSKNPAQIWYTPACPPDAAALYQFFVGRGILFDASSAPKPVTKPEKLLSPPKHTNLTEKEHTRLQTALAHVPADDRDLWVKLGIALKQNLPHDTAWQLWDDWSRKSDKYDPDDSEHTWRTIKDHPSDNSIGLGSIFYHAQNHGWSDDVASMPKEVEQFNDTHFVASQGGKTWVFKEDFNHELKRHLLQPTSFEDFKKLHQHKTVQVAQDYLIKKHRVAELWLNHPLRRTFEHIVFLPNQTTPPGTYNTWRGFACPSVPGDWSLMKKHIHEVICSRDRKAEEYLLNWMAFAVQHPDKPAEVAVVLQGSRGTGKGKFVNAMAALFGQHATTVTLASHLVGKFNGHLKDCVFLFVDEGMWAGDKAGESVLKALITEPLIQMEKKFQEATPCKNRLHIMMASNNDWVVPAGPHERRYFVLHVSDAKMQDKAYFAALDRQMHEQGGLEAMLYELQRRDLSNFDIRTAPRTAALDEQVINSLDPMPAWWMEHLGATLPEWQYQSRRALVESCMHKCSTPNQRSVETKLGAFLKKVLPGGLVKVSHTPLGTVRPVDCYKFPPQDVCRQAFVKYLGIQYDPWA